MVKLRLRRVGAKKQASYRIVATDSRSPRDGRFIEVIGFYNPRTEPETVQLKEDRALYWLSVGAQSTDAVTRLLKKMGTLDRFERLKKGESIEALVAEAETAAEGTPEISPKTRRAAAKKEAKPEAEEPKETAPAEAEAEAEPEVEEAAAAPEAEAEPEAEEEADEEAAEEANEEAAEEADEGVAEEAGETEAGEEAAEA